MNKRLDLIFNFIGSIVVIILSLTALFFFVYLTIKGVDISNISFAISLVLLITSIIDLINYLKRNKH